MKMTMEADSSLALARLKRLHALLTPESMDVPIAIAAAKILASVVRATPKRWTGALRRAWQMIRPGPAVRIIDNTSKVMGFLEYGTPKSAPGVGRIYPVNAKALYIPLNRNASMGWNPSLVRGTDYVLAASVRGIKPRGIVAKERIKALRTVYNEIRSYVSRLAARV